uniref:Putative secreted peptide n=1 Tax=Anopheles braziliensis TaxID=58242 RepID=A0A2M3ZQN9_9DIPT
MPFTIISFLLSFFLPSFSSLWVGLFSLSSHYLSMKSGKSSECPDLHQAVSVSFSFLFDSSFQSGTNIPFSFRFSSTIDPYPALSFALHTNKIRRII